MRISILSLILLMGLAPLVATSAVVVNSVSQTLSLLDLTTGTADNSFALLGEFASAAPNKAVVSGNYVYVVLTYENRVQKIDLSTGHEAASIFLDDSAGPNDIALAEGFAYITGNTNSRLYKIDLSANQVVSTLSVGQSPEGVSVCGDYVYVANCGFNMSDYSYDPGTVNVISTATFTAVDTVSVGLNPRVVVFSGNTPYVICTGNYADVSGEIDRLDPTTHELTAAVTVSGGCPGTACVANDGRIFMGNAYPAGVYVFDSTAGEITATPTTSGFIGGNALAVYGQTLASVDSRDYIQPSVVYFYNVDNGLQTGELTVGVGATDIDFIPDSTGVDDPPTIPAQHAVRMRLYPNPARGQASIAFSQSLPGIVNIRVFDIRGRQVRSLRSDAAIPTWDGCDEQGRPCATGIYLMRAENGGRTVATGKLTLLR